MKGERGEFGISGTPGIKVTGSSDELVPNTAEPVYSGHRNMGQWVSSINQLLKGVPLYNKLTSGF